MSGKLFLVFDGTCGFCSISAEWVKKWDQNSQISLVPCQNNREITRLGMDSEKAATSAWLVSISGRVHYKGAEAIIGTLAVVWQRPLLLQLYRLPLIRQCADLTYFIVSKIRQWFPIGIPYCFRYPEECTESERFKQSSEL